MWRKVLGFILVNLIETLLILSVLWIIARWHVLPKALPEAFEQPGMYEFWGDLLFIIAIPVILLIPTLIAIGRLAYALTPSRVVMIREEEDSPCAKKESRDL